MTSKDGHWRVTPISLDGRAILRIETDIPVIPTDLDGHHRTGPEQTSAGWYRSTDLAAPAELAGAVMAQLEEA